MSKMYKYVSINKPIYKLTFMDEVLYSEEQSYEVGLLGTRLFYMSHITLICPIYSHHYNILSK